MLVGCFLSPCTYALLVEDALLLKKEYQQYQAWVLSRDYFFGTSIKRNPIQALAWQQIYLNLLPATYPGKETLISFYKKDLSPQQISAATRLAGKLARLHQLDVPFSEVDLLKLYDLHETNASWNRFKPLVTPPSILHNWKDWLHWLKEHNYQQDALYLQTMMDDLYAKKQFPIVYGEIVINGPEAFERINAKVKISSHGFFIGHVNEKTLEFSLLGYNIVKINIDNKQQIQALSPIILSPQATNKKTGVVGRVLPWADLESNMVLRLVSNNYENKNIWYKAAANLTVIGSGQFYAIGLVPGTYELFISTAGINVVKRFIIHKNEIRGLSLIDLRKKLARN